MPRQVNLNLEGPIVKVFSKGRYGPEPISLHQDAMCQESGILKELIEKPRKDAPNGDLHIHVNMSYGALRCWSRWLYGGSMKGNTHNVSHDQLRHLAELYQTCIANADDMHDCATANACLDAIKKVLLNNYLEDPIRVLLDELFDGDLHGVQLSKDLRLEPLNMLVDIMIHSEQIGYGSETHWLLQTGDSNQSKIAPLLLRRGQRFSAGEIPDIMAAHAYHTHRCSTECCGHEAKEIGPKKRKATSPVG